MASKDEPLGMATTPRLLYSMAGTGNDQIGSGSGPVVVEAYINGEGQVYDYRNRIGSQRRGNPFRGREPAARQRF